MIDGGRIAVVAGRAVAVFALVALAACVEEFPTLVGIEVEMTSLSTADVSPRSIWGEPGRCTLVREVWIGDEVDRYERTLEGGRYERIVFEGVPLPLDTVGMPIEADGTIPPGTWVTSHALAMHCVYDDGSEQSEYRNVRRPFPRFERIEPRADLTTVRDRVDVVLEFVAELPGACALERRAALPDGFVEVERRIATPTGATLRFEAVPLVPPTVYDGTYEVPTVHDVLVGCDYRVEGGAWSQEDSFSVTTASAEPGRSNVGRRASGRPYESADLQRGVPWRGSEAHRRTRREALRPPMNWDHGNETSKHDGSAVRRDDPDVTSAGGAGVSRPARPARFVAEGASAPTVRSGSRP